MEPPALVPGGVVPGVFGVEESEHPAARNDRAATMHKAVICFVTGIPSKLSVAEFVPDPARLRA